MGAYDYLLAGKGIDLPNPLDLAAKGLTIGQLSNQVQTSSLDLQQRRQMLAMMQDPRYAAAMGQMMGDATGTGSDFGGLLHDYPAAAGPAMSQQIGMVKSVADIGKTRAEATKANTDAREKQLQVLANAAQGLATSDGPLMPDKVMTFLRQANFVGAQPLVADVMRAVQSGDEGTIRQSLLNFSQAGSTMAQRASARGENVRADLAPAEFSLKAYDVARQAAQWVGGGDIKQNAQGGYDIIRPNAGAPMPQLPPQVQQVLQQYGVRVVDGAAPQPGAPQRDAQGLFPAGTPASPVGSMQELQAADAAGQPASFTQGGQATQTPAAPVAPASGPGNGLPVVQSTGVQGALSPTQEALRKSVLEPTLAEATKGATVGQRVLQIIPPLRAELAQGFTGPLTNSEAGRALLSTLVQFGMVTPEQAQKYGAMRASDALSAELLGSIAHQLNPRGSNMVLSLAQRAKTGPVDPQEVAMTLLNALSTDARNTVAYGTALSDYIGKNPNDYGLAGWKPPTPRNAPPAGKFAQQLPPANLKNMGKIATDVDSGARFRSNGREWVEVK